MLDWGLSIFGCVEDMGFGGIDIRRLGYSSDSGREHAMYIPITLCLFKYHHLSLNPIVPREVISHQITISNWSKTYKFHSSQFTVHNHTLSNTVHIKHIESHIPIFPPSYAHLPIFSLPSKPTPTIPHSFKPNPNTPPSHPIQFNPTHPPSLP